MRKIKGTIKFIMCLVLIALTLLGYVFYIEPKITLTNQYDLTGSKPDAGQPLKVIQLSDIQISESLTEDRLVQLVDKVNRLSPDILVFTGDLFDNFATYQPVSEVTQALSDLEAVYGKYAVYGNRDYGGGASRKYEDIMAKSGFTVLKNEGTYLDIEGDKTVFIGGLDDALLGSPDPKATISSMDPDADYKILLLHEPDVADDFSDSSLDLILAGHSHGGQVKIPFSDGITTALAEKYRDGFYTINEETSMQLYVNTGIGNSHIPVRFLVPPEIVVFNLTI